MRWLLLIAFIGALGIAGQARAQGSAVPVCNVVAGQTHGCILTWIDGPMASIDASLPATREGRACAWNVLALVAVGDARVSTAMRNGRISRLASVDYANFELVPWYRVFSRFCTVARGE